MTASRNDKFVLTGRHVLAMFVGGFGIIITVNLVLAYSAIRTFPGLETENSYVSSQTFDRDRAAQDALGWEVKLTLDAGILQLSIRDRDGNAVAPGIVSATLGRPTNVSQDTTPTFDWTGDAFEAPVSLARGNWNLRLKLKAQDGTDFRRRIPFQVPG